MHISFHNIHSKALVPPIFGCLAVALDRLNVFIPCSLPAYNLLCLSFSTSAVSHVTMVSMLASPNMQSTFGYCSGIFRWMNRGSAPRCSISHSGCWAKPYNDHYRRQGFRSRKMPGTISWAANGQGPDTVENIPKPLGKRKVVEHVVLFRTKEGFSDEKEKDMLDFLYTSQYYMKGIIAISLGHILNKNVEGCTHALYMRFPSKEVLAQYYRNPFQSRVLNEYIIPYCHGSISLDFEAEVQDDIIPLFRRGEDFEYGVELFLLISVVEHASVYSIRESLDAFENLIQDFGSTIIQHTQGSNFSNNNKDYTHGIIVRFPSGMETEDFTYLKKDFDGLCFD